MNSDFSKISQPDENDGAMSFVASAIVRLDADGAAVEWSIGSPEIVAFAVDATSHLDARHFDQGVLHWTYLHREGAHAVWATRIDSGDGVERLTVGVRDDPGGQESPRRRRALVVDDQAMHLEMYGEMLTAAGYEVALASNGRDGIAQAIEQPPSVVLLDVRLPDINGFEVCRALRRSSSLDSAAIVITSSFADPGNQRRTKAVGGDAFLPGPVTLTSFGEVMGSLTPREQLQAIPAAVHKPARERVKLRLFGPMMLFSDDASHQVGRQRSRELLASLALSTPDALQGSTLMTSMWPDNPKGAKASLHQLVRRVRLELGTMNWDHLLVTEGQAYRLAIQATDVDVLDFELRARTYISCGKDELRRDLDDARAVVDSWYAAPFDDVSSNPIVDAATARLADVRAALVERIAVMLLHLNDADPAVRSVRDLLIDEPWRERCWALLMVALYRAGRQHEAVEAFQQARRWLVNELGIEPGPTLRTCEQYVLGQDPRLDGDDYLLSLADGLTAVPASISDLSTLPGGARR